MDEAIKALILRRGFLADEARAAERQIEKGLAFFDPVAAERNAEPEPASVRGARLQLDLLRGRIRELNAALKLIGYSEGLEEAEHG